MSLAATGRARAPGVVVVLAVAVVMLAWSGVALAQVAAAAAAGSAAPTSAAGDGTVEMTVVGTTGDLQRVRALVESRSLAGPGARWTRVTRFDPMEILRGDRDSSGASLRCWIDVVDPRRARLYFAARAGQQFLVRDVEMSGTFDEVDREALSQVIELSVSALLENERAGLTRAQTQALLASREPASPPRPPPPPPVAPPPELPPPTVTAPAAVDEPPGPPRAIGVGPTVGIFYRAEALGPDLPAVHGPGVVAAWGGLGGPRDLLGVWLAGQYQLPAEQIGAAIGLRFDTVAVQGGLQAYLPFERGGNDEGPALAGFTGRLGGGVDVVRVTPRPGSVDPSAMLAPSHWSQSLVLGAAVGVTWRAGRHLAAGVAASVDVLPTAVHYDLAVAGQTSAAFSPWRARPGVSVELSFR